MPKLTSLAITGCAGSVVAAGVVLVLGRHALEVGEGAGVGARPGDGGAARKGEGEGEGCGDDEGRFHGCLLEG
jgi:hypothetical protein